MTSNPLSHRPGGLDPREGPEAIIAVHAWPVVEVVGDDRVVPPGAHHGLLGDLRGGERQRGEDAAGVQAANAELTEQPVPLDVAGLRRRYRGVAAVGDAERPRARRSLAR
jgi:hypothetical protein